MARTANTLWGFALAMPLVAAVQTARVPSRLLSDAPERLPGVFGSALVIAAVLLWPALIPLLLSALPMPDRRRFVGVGVGSALFGAGAILLAAYGDVLPLPWYALPLAAVFGLLVAALAVPELPLPRSPSWTRPALLVAFAAAAALGSALDGAVLTSGYPSSHYAILLFVALAATLAMRPLGAMLAGLRHRRVALASTCLAALLLAATSADGRQLVLRHTTLGAAALVFRPITISPGTEQGPSAPPRDAVQLPEQLDLRELNVLLVTWEATGFRHTSLGGAAPATTPNLTELAALSRTYTRAYSPSSNTFQSMSAILGLGLPSTVPLRTSHRRWRGHLGSGVTTAAEHFRAMGARTLWVAHDYRRMFSREDGLVGLGRGFDDTQLVIGSWDPEVDRRVAERALKHIGRVASERFFAWVHLTSPHFPYVTHGESSASADRARHLGEVRFADAQLGTLMRGLERLGQAERTIVIVSADHGEEFGEHGGDAHGYTLYEEVVHVPLVVHVPGEEASVIETPISNADILPALLSHPSSPRRAQVMRQRTRSAEVLAAADGAVVSELLGRDRTQVALIWPDEKLIFDAHSGLVEHFDLASDPNEHRPRSETGRQQTLDAVLDAREAWGLATVH